MLFGKDFVYSTLENLTSCKLKMSLVLIIGPCNNSKIMLVFRKCCSI